MTATETLTGRRCRFCGSTDADQPHKDPIMRRRCIGSPKPQRRPKAATVEPAGGWVEKVHAHVRAYETIEASYREKLIGPDDVFNLLRASSWHLKEAGQ